MPKKCLHDYTAEELQAYYERQERKPRSLRTQKFYKELQPGIEKSLWGQLEFMRGNPDWEDPEMWFPAWDEEKAEEAFLTIKMREALDPQLFKAKFWVQNYVKKKENPKAHQLYRRLDSWLNRIIEILDEVEWQDLTTLAIAVTTWNYAADKLIEHYKECRGLA